MASSVASGRSHGSRGFRYRKVSDTSYVDESLFGSKKPKTQRRGTEARALRMAGEETVGGAAGRAGDASRTRGSQARGRGRGRGRGAAAAAHRQKPNVLRGSDLHRMQKESIIRTKADIRREAREREAERDRQWAAQAARKDRMKELEKRRLASLPLSELEQEEAEDAERERIRNRFMDQEAMDEVKKMTSLVKYAKTASVRERQLKEKKLRVEREKEEEKIRDLEVEIERMEQMRTWEDRDARQRAIREKAKEDILEQLEAAQEVRRQRGERLKKEAKETLAVIKRMEEEDRERARRQEARKKVFRQEVLRANEESILARKARKEAEVAEERRIEAIQKQMDEEAVQAQIEFEIAREKREQEAFKMRGNVQKFMDRRGEVDELRAQRVFEEGQRQQRLQDEENARRRAEAAAELKRVRDEQVREKELRTAMMIQADKEEFERNMRARRQWMDEEKEARRTRHDRDREHVKVVQKQAEELRAKARKEFERTQAEGAHEVEHRTDHYDRLEQVKARKIRELRAAGVEGKYIVELENFNPRKQDLDDYKLGPPRIKPKPE